LSRFRVHFVRHFFHRGYLGVWDSDAKVALE
jgi:hypothetical protein